MTTTIALFNNKGGVGKTTLAYHLAHMLSRLGRSVLAADLDPQANLTAHFLDDDELGLLWSEDEAANETVAGAVHPIMEGLGDVRSVSPREVAERLFLLPGDLWLSRFEERLAQEWPATLAGGNNAAIRVTTAFHRLVGQAAKETDADVVLIDVGPNLGALNRAALLVADHVLVPLGADLFSAQGLRNLGPSLRRWRGDWQGTALPRVPSTIDAPAGRMNPLGYVVMRPSMRLDRPVKAYQLWLERIPEVYATAVLGESGAAGGDHEIGTVRNFRSLMPLARDARKPMFDLRAADGAIGSTQRFVQVCLTEFRGLATEVLRRVDLASDVTPDDAA
jgi:cellulose biosynthesis protein BcsQ